MILIIFFAKAIVFFSRKMFVLSLWPCQTGVSCCLFNREELGTVAWQLIISFYKIRISCMIALVSAVISI